MDLEYRSACASLGGDRRLFGIDFEVGRANDVLDRIDAAAQYQQHRGVLVTHVNLNTLFHSAQDAELGAALVHPGVTLLFEGVALKVARFMTALDWWPDVNGTDLVPLYLARHANSPMRIALVGGRPGVAAAAARRLQHSFPNVQIVAEVNGYGDLDDERTAMDVVREAGADLILVGLGTPLQEPLAMRWAAERVAPLFWTVGGLFDLWAGTRTRAPRWSRACRLEWLWRLVCRPDRYWQRTLIHGPWLAHRIWRHWWAKQ